MRGGRARLLAAGLLAAVAVVLVVAERAEAGRYVVSECSPSNPAVEASWERSSDHYRARALCGTDAGLQVFHDAEQSDLGQYGAWVWRAQQYADEELRIAVQDAIGLRAFFCDPHSPWQRGGIENANGRLRRDLPRKASLSGYSDKDIDAIVWNLNATPRKCLGFKTPIEAFASQLGVALEM